MTDLTLTCAHCGNLFVFSQGEQDFYQAKGLEIPLYCPICRAIKKSETLHPPKPKP